MQQDLFGKANQLEGVRICLNGTFSIEVKRLNKLLKDCGVSYIDRVASREYEDDEAIPPIKGDFITKKNTFLQPISMF